MWGGAGVSLNLQTTYHYLRAPGPTAGCGCPFEQAIPPEKESEGSFCAVQPPLPRPAPCPPAPFPPSSMARENSDAKVSSEPFQAFS